MVDAAPNRETPKSMGRMTHLPVSLMVWVPVSWTWRLYMMNCDEITLCSGGINKSQISGWKLPKLFRKVCNFATSTLWLSGISAFSAGGRMAAPAAWRLGVSISDCPAVTAVDMTQFSHQFVGRFHLFPNRVTRSHWNFSGNSDTKEMPYLLGTRPICWIIVMANFCSPCLPYLEMRHCGY